MKENIRLISTEPLSRENKEFLVSLVTAWFIVCVITAFAVLAVVHGPSMEPTLQEGDILLVSRVSKIEKGDIVIARPEMEYVVKRVAGVEGDVVNGTAISENCYYLLGDNSDNSYDSRDFGETDKILGKVLFRLYPHPGKLGGK